MSMPDTRITVGGTNYDLPPPEFGYETTIYVALHHSPIRPKGYVVWDDGAATDYRTCKCTFLLSAADTRTLREVLKDSDKGRGIDCTLTLTSGSGFFPGGPDKGDAGNFTIRVFEINAEPVLDHPHLYFRTSIGFVITAYPSYALPSEVDEGSLQIGGVDGLRFPPNGTQSKATYSYATQITRSGAPYTIDKTTDDYETVLPMVCNQSKSAALIDHLIADVRGANLSIVAPAYSYLFNELYDTQQTHTCKWINNVVKIRHGRYNDFEFDVAFHLVS